MPYQNLFFASKSICKITIETKLEIIIGAGFLLKFYIDQEMFYCLVTNEYVIKNDIIQNNYNIIFFFMIMNLNVLI